MPISSPLLAYYEGKGAKLGEEKGAKLGEGKGAKLGAAYMVDSSLMVLSVSNQEKR